MKFEVIEAKAFHCGQMARILRAEHQAEIAKTGFGIHRELVGTFESSFYRRALLLDGRLIALGGCAGSSLATLGYVWLAVSNEARKHPLAIMRHARTELARMMITKRDLMATVLAEDEAAKRTAVFLGFYPGRCEPFGNRTRHARMTLRRELENDTNLRLPCGDTYHIALIFHPERAMQ